MGSRALLSLVLLALPALAAPPEAPPLPQSAERLEQGLTLKFETIDGKAGDTRQARLPALYMPQGAAPTPFLPAGRFRATWTGDLNLRLRERMAFLAEGRGKLTVKIKDKVVLEVDGEDLSTEPGEVARLDKGKNPIVVVYESPAEGDAFMRLSWKEQRGLRAEPVPLTVLTHDASAPDVARGERLRRGRQLLADLRCTKCHATEATGMPELAMDAPALTDAGWRLNQEWMARWVADPRSIRKDAHMPRVLQDDAAVEDVAAYLIRLSTFDAQRRFIDPNLAPRGGELFAALNCVACHTTPDAAKPGTNESRVPLAHVGAKFLPDTLAAYLLNPHAHYAWNPMPNFRLNQKEADGIAAYLMKSTPERQIRAAKGDPARGKQLVRSAGCLNCHAMEGEKSELQAPTLASIDGARWTQGCMGADPAARKGAPDFGLSDDNRHALLAFAATGAGSLAQDSAAEFSARQVAAMRCTACHARDGKESLLATDYAADAAALAAAFPLPQAAAAVHEGEHFAPDQRPPMLTWAGEKLRPEWSAAFIAGALDYKPRPYLHARMPAWPARAKLLAEGLSAEHGYAPKSDAYPPPDPQMAAVGQRLIGAAGGFSCVQCHAVGAAPPLAPFEAPAMNMAHMTERLRKDYYHRWMLNPIKVDPATKMPSFSDIEAKSAIRDVYDGDATKQFEAVWQFLLRGRDVTPPQ